ncbi:actin-related protein [Salix suchowensis]|nr:actin-related protein [Salix suchowensis]
MQRLGIPSARWFAQEWLRADPRESKWQAKASKSVSVLPQYASTALVHDYLVGSQLDEALAAGQDIAISWPFADGTVRDWVQAEALCVAVNVLRVVKERLRKDVSVVLRATQCGWVLPSRTTYGADIQLEYHTGVVVDIGHEKTDVTPVLDGLIIHNARTTSTLGVRDCQAYLANLLRTNQTVTNAFSPQSTSRARSLEQPATRPRETDNGRRVRQGPFGRRDSCRRREGITDIAAIVVAGKEKAVIESGMKKKANAKASAAEQARAREIEA